MCEREAGITGSEFFDKAAGRTHKRPQHNLGGDTHGGLCVCAGTHGGRQDGVDVLDKYTDCFPFFNQMKGET